MTYSKQSRMIVGTVFCLLLVLIVLLQISTSSAQITFSKDWRAGGKRSAPSTTSFQMSSSLANNGITLVDIPCDQMADYSSQKIRDLLRKEAIALLQCDFVVNKSKGPSSTNSAEKK